MDADTPPPSQSSTRNKPRLSKTSPKKGASIYSSREEEEKEEEQADSLCDRYTDQLTEQGDVDDDTFAYFLWTKGHISNKKIEQTLKSEKENRGASNFKKRLSLNPVLSKIPEKAESVYSMDSCSTRPTTRSMTIERRLINSTLSNREPSRLAKIVTILIEGARAPDRLSPERLQSSDYEIIKQHILSTYISNIKNPNPALRLYAKICDTGCHDPTKEWLNKLGIPCSAVYTNSTYIATNSSFTLDQDQSFSRAGSIPPDSVYTSSEDEDESDDDTEETEPEVLERPMRSSAMTMGDMARCNWDFCDEVPEVDVHGSSTSAPDEKAPRSLRDITIRPRMPRTPRLSGRRGQKSLGLQSKLLIEIHRQMDDLSSQILYLPKRWKSIGQMKTRLPELALPDEYKAVLGKLDRRRSGSKVHGTSKTQAIPSVSHTKRFPSIPSDCSSQSSRSEEFYEQSYLDNALIQELRKRYLLNSNEARDICQARELQVVINDWNAITTHLNCTVDLYNAVRRSLGACREVRWISDEAMLERDRMYRSGNFTINERIYNCTIPEQGIIRDFLSYLSPRDALSEGEVESGTGAILHKIMAGDGITDKRNCQLRFPLHLRPVVAMPHPDSYARVNFADELGWHEDLKPIIFGSECKTKKTQTKNTRAQLAVAFHATLIILILYYLDNRSCASDPLPEWLFLYGIEYIEHGFVVHVHYPHYNFDDPNAGWGFTSAMFTDKFSEVFKGCDTGLRLSALAFLFRMRSQGMFVMEKLKAWDHAPEVLWVLQRQAYEERHGPLQSPARNDVPCGKPPKRTYRPRVTI